ncbi:MAG TPA: glycosyltransferase family 2 protein [Chitinophagaceae bacterium]|nr:glycosyltransferase family 2 protein [Chitinophagaceae bacterium]
MKKLSIIIPCFNEENLISTVLEKVLHTKLTYNLEKQIIVVNDGSTDNSANKINLFCEKNSSVVSIHQTTNAGKGAAIKAALQKTDGDIIMIQDADFEYDPNDYNKLLHPILDGHADVVYGSRFMGSGPHRVLFFFHTIGNKFLTFLSNIFTGLNLTDMETGYKMFKTDVLKEIHLKENRFGFEPEVTAKVSRIKNIRFYEVGIAYYGRTYNDGKKIKWTDGFYAIWCILKYNIFSRK